MIHDTLKNLKILDNKSSIFGILKILGNQSSISGN